MLLLALLCMAVSSAASQNKIPADAASSHTGEKVTVCDSVYGVKSLDKLTFINIGAAYPDAPLTLVIFAKDLPAFKASPAVLYNNKKICVTGKIELFKGKPQIVVTQPEEIVFQ